MTLQEWMDEREMTDALASKHFGRTAQTVWRWRTGRSDPSAEDKAMIFEKTQGRVTPNDFYAIDYTKFDKPGSEPAHSP
ncbi:hypothetical protein [Marinicauda sp. Alg238-R41]|uniref:hypothetical protein n=1 Tax=Marinicauda sp. Alg238-R41 TaxID=2993447 RepID=UPI0022E4F193|nr:hypothetical protein [Marinicauda sp. Alg238-R41]